ncbi:hypothetical protein [Nitrincola tapanii]|uniref:Uncharacterized protein n=1 Tax=Nitrincola tapanii TaxID=1708751 RepID=A0A5A9W4E3_9GAMM|nr:hypothetical protein [Nitrincola tapanii]KAA0875354.1 hypothetical protein E1H14_05020 [Nitrincola tapanii]
MSRQHSLRDYSGCCSGILLGAVLCVFTTQVAWSHYPYIDCEKAVDEVICQVGFSDGTDAVGAEVVMFSYDEEPLARATADDFSRATFTWQDQPFYIQFDAGHEDPAEYDYAEL